MNLTKIRRCLLLGLFLLVSCKVSEPAVQPTSVPEMAVNELGQYMASWANMHCTNIAIENAPILIEDGNAGGCSQVWWQHPEGLAFEERGDNMPAAIRLGAEQWHNKNEAVSSLLTDRLNASDCNLDQLLQEAALFSVQTSEDEVAGYLSCLGEINFVPVEVGIE